MTSLPPLRREELSQLPEEDLYRLALHVGVPSYEVQEVPEGDREGLIRLILRPPLRRTITRIPRATPARVETKRAASPPRAAPAAEVKRVPTRIETKRVASPPRAAPARVEVKRTVPPPPPVVRTMEVKRTPAPPRPAAPVEVKRSPPRPVVVPVEVKRSPPRPVVVPVEVKRSPPRATSPARTAPSGPAEMCPVCMEETSDLLDCKHPLCAACTGQMCDLRCPTCRAPFQARNKETQQAIEQRMAEAKREAKAEQDRQTLRLEQELRTDELLHALASQERALRDLRRQVRYMAQMYHAGQVAEAEFTEFANNMGASGYFTPEELEELLN